MIRNGNVSDEDSRSRVLGVGWAFLDDLIVVDRFPKEDTKTSAGAIVREAGGPVPRALLTLRALAPTIELGLVSVLGEDPAGELVKARLSKQRIRLFLESQGTWKTRTSVAWLAADTGSRTVVYEGFEDVHYELPADTKHWLGESPFSVLHLDGRDVHAARDACNIVQDSGGRVVIDLGSLKPGVMEFVDRADTIIAPLSTLRELLKFEGRKLVPDAARELLSGRCTTLFVTDGSREVRAFSPTEELSLKAFDVPTVDSNGAGDAFAGGVLFGTIRRWPLGRTLKIASAVAALKCAGLGNSSLPDLATAERLIRGHGRPIAT